MEEWTMVRIRLLRSLLATAWILGLGCSTASSPGPESGDPAVYTPENFPCYATPSQALSACESSIHYNPCYKCGLALNSCGYQFVRGFSAAGTDCTGPVNDCYQWQCDGAGHCSVESDQALADTSYCDPPQGDTCNVWWCSGGACIKGTCNVAPSEGGCCLHRPECTGPIHGCASGCVCPP
jgi:hypothetical protein